MKCDKQIPCLISLSLLLYFSNISNACSDQSELLDLTVEDLLNIHVTSVAKKTKSLNNSPAAIYVITQDDIKRIGASSIPEALRLAPGLDVSRIDGNKWAVSVRGFNSRFANKLLVLIDGRNTYMRTNSGTYWENQDVMMEDIERIEIIRGPGASLWGANAVNGVINIISKTSTETLGGILVAGGGTEKQGLGAFRYGLELFPDTTARAYFKGSISDENTFEEGGESGDAGEHVQAGFRMDSQLTFTDTLTVQGDYFHNNFDQNTTSSQLSEPFQNNFNETVKSLGGNLLIRQDHRFSISSDYSLQFYYDYYQRSEFFTEENSHTLDFDFQHRFSILDWNDIVWGVGYRYSANNFRIDQIGKINSPSQNDQIASAFLQDEITLVDDYLWLTLGSKFEHNDYSGFEFQPTAKLMWAPHNQHRLWAAISRAVRTPARSEQESNILTQVVVPQALNIPPVAVLFMGNEKYDSEEVISVEMGYRTTIIENISIDATAFFNDYSNLRSLELGAVNFNGAFLEQAIFFANNYSAHSYGFEISTVWQMLDWWRWDAHYSLFKIDYQGLGALGATGYSPQQQVSLRSAISPLDNLDLDLLFRFIDSNTAVVIEGESKIKAYVSLDIRLAWRPVNELELSLVGQNLLAEHHLEYRQETFTRPTEIDRGMYGKISWQF